MKRISILPVLIAVLSACSAHPTRQTTASTIHRPSFVDSVTALPDGTKEIVVSGKFSPAPSGSQVQSVNLRERLEQAAKAECSGGDYELTPSETIGNASGKSSGLKFTLKGKVRCAAAK